MRTVAVVLALAAMPTAEGQQGGPRGDNVVLIYLDNVGWGDLACYGNPTIRTPNIDRLATEGTRLTDFYIPSSSCSPSRSALLTGRHPDRNGLAHQLSVEENWSGIGLPHTERILPELLRERGYATGAFGKWNLGFAEGSRPTDRGFDEYIGCISGNCDYYTHIYNGRLDMRVGTEPRKLTGYTTDIFADAAAEFVRRNASRPFFVYVPFNAAHCPNPKNKAPGQPFRWQAPAEFFEAYGFDPGTDVPQHGYHAVMTALDAGVGKVLDALEATRVVDRTLVILASDNGGRVAPRRPALEVASNAPFRGGRTSVYEGGVRTPCILRWPGRVQPGSVVREPLTNMDLFVLALSAGGAEPPQDRVIDGRDPLPALRDGARSPHRNIYFRYREARGLRQGPWKAVLPQLGSQIELYDLSVDPGERRDLAPAMPDIAARLAEELRQWQASLPSRN